MPKFLIKRDPWTEILQEAERRQASGERLNNEHKMVLEGRRYVNFTWPLEPWREFVTKCCDGRKPNEVVWELVLAELKKS